MEDLSLILETTLELTPGLHVVRNRYVLTNVFL